MTLSQGVGFMLGLSSIPFTVGPLIAGLFLFFPQLFLSSTFYIIFNTAETALSKSLLSVL
jgi:ABC-type sulfate transport system permease subunit